MTLQNGLIHNGRAFLWTDTRLYSAETGETLGEVSKAFTGTFPALFPWAATLSGAMLPNDLYRVQRLIGDAMPMNPAELIAACVSVMRSEAAEGRMGRILLAHICPQYGARMFMIASDDTGGSWKPFEPFETVEYMSNGAGEPWAAEFLGNDTTPESMLGFIDRQIDVPGETIFGWSGRTIGGNLVEIVVSAGDVSSRVVRELDKVESCAA